MTRKNKSVIRNKEEKREKGYFDRNFDRDELINLDLDFYNLFISF